MNSRGVGAVLIVLALCCIALPAPAVLLEVTYLGTVTSLDPAAGTVGISASARYGCSYSNGQAQCGWNPITPVVVTCPVPDTSVFSFLKAGDTVEATSMGGEQGTWIAISRLQTGTVGSGDLVTDLAGDPRSVQSGYSGGYQVDASTSPDCSTCYGTRCSARSATVTVTKEGSPVIQKELFPGESAIYTGESSRISVTFIKGQTSSYACPGSAGSGMMGGIQPVSVFIVRITPASGGEAGIVTPVTDLVITPDLPIIIPSSSPVVPVVLPVLPEITDPGTFFPGESVYMMPVISYPRAEGVIPLLFPVEDLFGEQAPGNPGAVLLPVSGILVPEPALPSFTQGAIPMTWM